VKPVGDLSAANRARQPGVPAPRGREEVPRADLQPLDRRGRHGHGDPLLADRRATASAPRQRGDAAPQLRPCPPGPLRDDRVRLSSPPGCWSPRASRSGTRSMTRRAGRAGGAGSRRPRSWCPATRTASARFHGWSGKALLPYRVEFEVTSIRVEHPNLMEGHAVGELEGSAAGASTSRTASPPSSMSGASRLRSRG